MFEMRLQSLVNHIVRSELSKNIKEGQAMHLVFDVELYDYDLDEKSERTHIHLLYSCIPNGNTITVFSGVSKSRDPKKVEWSHETTHDSCWTTVRVFNREYFEMAEKLNSSRVQDGLKEKAPKDFSQHNSFPIFSESLYTWVNAKITKDPNDTFHYRKLVEIL